MSSLLHSAITSVSVPRSGRQGKAAVSQWTAASGNALVAIALPQRADFFNTDLAFLFERLNVSVS